MQSDSSSATYSKVSPTRVVFVLLPDFVFQAKTAATSLRRNLCFNLPRAGFNFNGLCSGPRGVALDRACGAPREARDEGGGVQGLDEAIDRWFLPDQ